MSADGETVLGTRAYVKLVLHAARYPHAAVCGVLLGAGGARGEPLRVVDVVPLFHQCLHVAPMYEVALTQVEAAASARGQSIVGMYLAAEHYRHVTAERLDLRVADKVAEQAPGAALLVLDNTRLTLAPERALRLYRSRDGGWRQCGDGALVFEDEEAEALAGELLQHGVQRDLVDYDLHLDDLAHDWTNPGLDTLLRSLGHE